MIHRWIMLWVLLVIVLEGGLLVWLEWHVADRFDDANRRSTEQAGLLARSSLHLGMHASSSKPDWALIGEGLPVGKDTRITFVDQKGKVLWATNPARRGQRYDLEDPKCRLCHQGEAAIKEPRPVLTTAPGGLAEDLYATPLMNEKGCQGCHGKERKKLGVLYARRVTASSNQFQGMTQVSLGVLGVLTLVITFLLGRFVVHRFGRKLVAELCAARPASRRDLLTELGGPPPARPRRVTGPPAPRGPLVRSDTSQLRVNLQKVAEQRENLEILYGIAEELSDQASLDDRRRRVVQQVTRIFHSDSLLISGHTHPESGTFHGLITYLHKGQLEPTEVPYPHDGIERLMPHYDQELVDRWMEGEFDLTTRIFAGSTVGYPLERHGKRLGLFLVPARPKSEDRPTGANPDVVQALRKHLAASLQLADLQRVMLRQERLAAIGATVAGMAHCLKNTLNALRGGQYVVEKAIQKEEFPRLKKGYRVLKFGVGQIERLTQDMLMYASDRKLKREPVDPNPTLEEVAGMLHETARHQNVTVATDLDRTIGEVAMDQHAIYRAVLNLATNAVDACVESEHGDHVLVMSRCRGGNLVITISDNGVGMAPEILRRVSEQFFTTKPSKGTGLGLPVVEKIAKQHGGALQIESEEGKGSSFHLIIPA